VKGAAEVGRATTISNHSANRESSECNAMGRKEVFFGCFGFKRGELKGSFLLSPPVCLAISDLLCPYF